MQVNHVSFNKPQDPFRPQIAQEIEAWAMYYYSNSHQLPLRIFVNDQVDN